MLLLFQNPHTICDSVRSYVIRSFAFLYSKQTMMQRRKKYSRISSFPTFVTQHTQTQTERQRKRKIETETGKERKYEEKFVVQM